MVPERKPRQLHLEVAHRGGMVGMWPQRYKHEEELGPSITNDPDRGIDNWHHKTKGAKIREKDFQHQWQQQLKEWGCTQANKHRRIEEMFEDARRFLKEKGVWSLIEKDFMTLEERVRVHIINQNPPIRDPYSSEGITFYPTGESMWADMQSGLQGDLENS